MFVLIVVVLILIYVTVSDGVSSLITALFSFGITLLVFYSNGGNDYDGLSIALDIKPGACGLGGYNSGAYSLPI